MYQNLTRKVDPDAPESVHLGGYPETEAGLVDAELLKNMGLLLKVVRLGRAARNESRLKSRQPLAEAVVCVREAAEAESLKPFVKEVLEELNVKNVTFSDSADEYVKREVKLNHKVAGPKLKGLVKGVQKALEDKGADEAAKIAAAVRAGEKIAVTVDGQSVTLDAEDVSVVTTAKEGYATADESGYVVAVNTELSEELLQEGMARDLVRNIQEMRKKAGFEISDRIELFVPGPADQVRAVLDAFGDYIAQETLSVSLKTSGAPGDAFEDSVRLGDEGIKVAIRKTAAK
jgi:isoleucyl-tRNA synthetase